MTRGTLWLSVGLYAALAITLFAPLIVAFLWSLVDPKAGWFAPEILPPSLSLHHWKAAANDRGLVASMLTSLFDLGVRRGALGCPRAADRLCARQDPVPGQARGRDLHPCAADRPRPDRRRRHRLRLLPDRPRLYHPRRHPRADDRHAAVHDPRAVGDARGDTRGSDPAARTLGATPLKVGWHILVPLAWPGFVAGGLLSFVASFEEFEKTFIVGAPLVETLTVKLWATLGGKVMIFPNAAVVTFIVLLPTVIIFFLAERAMRNDGALAAGMGKL